MAKNQAAIVAIKFGLDLCERISYEHGLSFLRAWNEGDFDVIRKEWPNAPEEVFLGVRPLIIEY